MALSANVDPLLLDAMKKAVETIQNQSPEELAENIRKRELPIDAASRRTMGFLGSIR